MVAATPPEGNSPSESNIGSRVSIRLHDPEGGYRDVLGTLETLTTVRKKDGTLATFDPMAIALWKVVPTK
jgi:hypothetical protein